MSFKRKYMLNESIFNNLNENTAYWIGFLYGDGNCTTENKIRLELQWNDKEHLIEFRAFVGSIDRPIKEKKNELHNVHNCSFEFRSWKIHNALSKYNLTLVKSKRPRLHIDLLQKEIRRHFLRGLFDADGCFFFATNKTLHSEITGYTPLLQDVKNILVTENIINETKKIVKNGSIHRIRLATKDTIKLINYLYKGNDRYNLKRKLLLINSYRERLNEQTLLKGEATVQL